VVNRAAVKTKLKMEQNKNHRKKIKKKEKHKIIRPPSPTTLSVAAKKAVNI